MPANGSNSSRCLAVRLRDRWRRAQQSR